MKAYNHSSDSFCVHGHFYQPPREDPFTHLIPNETGAAPFHDWNQRISAECYRPNAALGNFEQISFDFGPTLAMWMEQYEPDTHALIVQQAQAARERTGVPNAMAQSFNHTILPLATREEKEIQVEWGIRDYENRFGGKPEGLWLPETAVDLETLSVLAENGISFTILAPWQVEGEPLQARQAYQVDLGAGKQIAVFFYNRPLSDKISFDAASTAHAGKFLTQNLLPEFDRLDRPGEQTLVMAASDGEVYGHHHQGQEKFLHQLLTRELKKPGMPANRFPSEYLRQAGKLETIAIREDTSWSCHHGILKWLDECPCTPNGSWKNPLRKAFDAVAQIVDREYKAFCNGPGLPYLPILLAYIEVITKRVSNDAFLAKHAAALDTDDRALLSLLLQAQYERHRMYTSCGWFFEDFDRIEPRNNVAYAAAALTFLRRATGHNYSPELSELFSKVKSWRSGLTADTVLRGFMDHLHSGD